MSNASKSVGVLMVGMLGALILAIFGDIVIDIAFDDGSTGETIVEYSPIIVLALAFYGAFRHYEKDE